MSRSMRSALRRFALAATTAGTLVAPAAAVAGPVTPVPSLDVQQYLGRWQEVASIPQWYEALCQRNTNANYALNADGTVRVVNRCSGPGGLPITLAGQARVLDKTTNAQLQVSFLNFGTGFIYPNSDPNYIVMGLGPDYRWAVVGDPQRTSGFVLARTGAITAAEKSQITTVLTENGFDPCALRYTPQQGGVQSAGAFCS